MVPLLAEVMDKVDVQWWFTPLFILVGLGSILAASRWPLSALIVAPMAVALAWVVNSELFDLWPYIAQETGYRYHSLIAFAVLGPLLAAGARLVTTAAQNFRLHRTARRQS